MGQQKFVAPENCTSVNVGSEAIDVDADGTVSVDDQDSDAAQALLSHGFTIAPTKPTGKKDAK